MFLPLQVKNSPVPLCLKSKARKSSYKLYHIVFEGGRKGKYLISREKFPFLLKNDSPSSLLQVLKHPSMDSNKITVIQQRIKKKKTHHFWNNQLYIIKMKLSEIKIIFSKL